MVKALSALVLAVLVCLPVAAANIAVILGGGVPDPAGGPTGIKSLQFAASRNSFTQVTAGNYFLSLSGDETPTTTRANHESEVTVDGVYSRLVGLSTKDIGGSGDNLVVELLVNGSSCSPDLVKCSIIGDTGDERSCPLDTDTCDVSAGDAVVYQWDLAGTGHPSSTYASLSIQFQADSGNKSLLFSGSTNTSSADRWIPLQGFGDAESAIAQREGPAPLTGSLTDFVCTVEVTPTGGDTRTLEVFEDGAGYVTAGVDCLIATDTNTCTPDTTLGDYTQGKLYVIKSTSVGNPGASDIACSLTLISDDGGFVFLTAGDENSNETATEYWRPGRNDTNWTDDRPRNSMIAGTAFTATDFYCEVETPSGAASSGKDRAVTFMDDATGTLTCNLFETATQCSETGQTDSVAVDSLVSFEQNPDATAPDSTDGFACSLAATIP